MMALPATSVSLSPAPARPMIFLAAAAALSGSADLGSSPRTRRQEALARLQAGETQADTARSCAVDATAIDVEQDG